MKMIRKPTYAGHSKEKDNADILFWATHKTPAERLIESWRLHCISNNISSSEDKLDKTKASAHKR